MAHELPPSPIDAQTGLPLLILPVEPPPHQRSDLREDYDHKWFEHRDPRLRGPGGRSLRYSFGQDLPRWQHNLRHQLMGGPPLPDKDDYDEQFRLTALGCAGLASPYAIDVTSDNWMEPVRMTDEQYAYATDPKRLHIETYSPRRARTVRTHIGKFFAAYAVEQHIGHMSPKVIKDFLHTKDPGRKRELGNLLLRWSVESAVEPLKPVKRAFAEAYDRPDVQGWDLARKVRKFFPVARFSDYYGVLTARLLDSQVA